MLSWSLHRSSAWLPLALVAILAPGCLRKMPTGIERIRMPELQEEIPVLPPAPAEGQFCADAPTSEPRFAAVPGPLVAECLGAAASYGVEEDRPPVKSADARPRAAAPAGGPPEEPEPDEPSADLRAIPRLLLEVAAAGSAGAVVYEALTRAELLLPVLHWRNLDLEQRKERDAGATFIVQAREALAASEAGRAAVLADKAVALIENLELATRP